MYIYKYRGEWYHGREPVTEKQLTVAIENNEMQYPGTAGHFQVFELVEVPIMLTPTERVVTDIKARVGRAGEQR